MLTAFLLKNLVNSTWISIFFLFPIGMDFHGWKSKLSASHFYDNIKFTNEARQCQLNVRKS